MNLYYYQKTNAFFFQDNSTAAIYPYHEVQKSSTAYS